MVCTKSKMNVPEACDVWDCDITHGEHVLGLIRWCERS